MLGIRLTCMDQWTRKALLWLCVFVGIGFMIFAKMVRDFNVSDRALHEQSEMGEILGAVALGRALGSGQNEGRISLDDPVVKRATELKFEDSNLRIWSYIVKPSKDALGSYDVSVHPEMDASKGWTGPVSPTSGGVNDVRKAWR